MSFAVNVNLDHLFHQKHTEVNSYAGFSFFLAPAALWFINIYTCFQLSTVSTLHRRLCLILLLYLLLDVSCYLSWIVSSIKLKLNLRRCYLSALHQIYIKFTFNARKIMTQNNDSKFRHRVSSKIERYIHTLELVTDLILSLKTGEDFSLKIPVTQQSKLWGPF